MAIFRKIHTSFWSDSFISDLDRDKKLFYIYLLTNDKTKQCGIYEITKKHISYDLGYSIDTVSKLLQYFIKIGKIRYNEDTKELAIKNWAKYNNSTSPKVKSCINKELEAVKDKVLIQYIYSIDTASQEEEEQEEEQEEEEEEEEDKILNDSFILFWDLYDKKVGSKEKCISKFNKLKSKEIKKIFETLPLFKCQFSDKQYQPFPETYLNNKRWNDELQGIKQTGQLTSKEINALKGKVNGKYYSELDDTTPHYIPYYDVNNKKFNKEYFDKWNYGNNL